VDRAESHFKQAITLLAKLGDAEKAPAVWLAEIEQQNNLASLLGTSLLRVDDAAECRRRVVELRRRLAEADPGKPGPWIDLDGALKALAAGLRAAGKSEEMHKAFASAIARMRGRIKKEPKQVLYRHLLVLHHLSLAGACLDDDDHVRAARTVNDGLAEVPAGWNSWPAAAEVMARAASLAAADAKLDAAGRKETAKTYADKAMELLTRGFKAGFRDARTLRGAKEFAALKDRADFQKLLTAMEKK